jgi:isoamylase
MEAPDHPAERQSRRLAAKVDEAFRETPLTPDPSCLGAVWDGNGVTFSVLSRHATQVDLCLFADVADTKEVARHSLTRDRESIWRIHLPDIEPGQLYGYRAHGPWEPARGHRFDPAALLIDPSAHALCGTCTDNPSPVTAKSLVVDPYFDWQEDRPPAIPWRETVIYECHVRGLTRRHPEIPEELRGTYLGLAQEPVLEHLSSLGVTAIELLPVQHFLSERHLLESGLSNYFGYNPIAFFAPHPAYASGDAGQQVQEFKTMVQGVHRAGMEVILDVVFNHTAEGDHRGPTLSLKGLDNRLYYRLRTDDLEQYENFSGCGNTLDTGDPRVAGWVVECLRYWVEEMHVDGFRFDLATTLGRYGETLDSRSPFFQQLEEDPALASVKLIAEPWDLGPEGYRLGRFPRGWAEWNDRYRDDLRSFWRGDRGSARALARRMEGSADIFPPARRPAAESSINFVTCHDGFTLQDLVSYEHKHNLANGEENRDGHNHNLSRNWGVEGPTKKPAVLLQRERVKKSLLATLAFSRGTPMLGHGDEMGRTQQGNNNAYCQDNELTWVDWELDDSRLELLEFVRQLFSLRRRLTSGDRKSSAVMSWTWISASGWEMTAADWRRTGPSPLGLLLGDGPELHCLLLNPADQERLFSLPRTGMPGGWHEILNTDRFTERSLPGRSIRLAPSSVLLLAWIPAN